MTSKQMVFFLPFYNRNELVFKEKNKLIFVRLSFFLSDNNHRLKTVLMDLKDKFLHNQKIFRFKESSFINPNSLKETEGWGRGYLSLRFFNKK